MSNKIRWQAFLALAILLSLSCKEEKCNDPTDPGCPNYDPCFDAVKPDAGFSMSDYVGLVDGQSFNHPEDTIFKGTRISFLANTTSAEINHKWYLGAELIEQASFSRLFRDVPRPAVISVSHVISYPVDSACFPEDDGLDSLFKQFYLIDYFSELASTGTFRVSNVGEQDSFDFRVNMINPDGSPARFGTEDYFAQFINLGNQQDTVNQAISYFTSDNLGLLSGVGQYPNSGFIEIKADGKLVEVELRYGSELKRQAGRKLE